MAYLLPIIFLLLSCSDQLERLEFISIEDLVSSSSNEASSSSDGESSSSSETSSSSSKTYETFAIGGQIWMAENLSENLPGSRCYNNDYINCATHGRLYSWALAAEACPEGWRLPSDEDWNALIEQDHADHFKILGGKGHIEDDDELYYNIDAYGNWWTSTPASETHAYYIFTDGESAEIPGGIEKENLFSVRCILSEPGFSGFGD